MNDFVNAVVLGDHKVRHLLNGAEAVNTASDGEVRMTRGAFNDAKKFGAVRLAKPVSAPVATTDDAPTETSKPSRRL